MECLTTNLELLNAGFSQKVKVKNSENAVSVHLFWLHFLAFDGPVSVSTVVFLSS